jgi:sec-independent protein translocase protein TatB
MFDFDMSKMAVIGVVALVVLGPDRLPRVARTTGALLGRAQRYVSNVQAEVDRQIRMDELRKVKSSIEQTVADVQGSVERTVRQQAGELQSGVDSMATQLKEALPDVYLPSVHERGGDAQAEWFKTRPAQLDVAMQGDAFFNDSRNRSVDSSAAQTSAPQRVRSKWRSAASAGRRASIKRSRIVSTAAGKALGRDAGRRHRGYSGCQDEWHSVPSGRAGQMERCSITAYR